MTREASADQKKHPGYHLPLTIKSDYLTKETWQKREEERAKETEKGSQEEREEGRPEEREEGRPEERGGEGEEQGPGASTLERTPASG